MAEWSTAAVMLKCVRCGSVGLSHDANGYRCRTCEAGFPAVEAIPRFVAAEFYGRSFGFQWNRFARTQLDSASGGRASRDTFVEKTGQPLELLAGRTVLDAGCGMGRFAEVCADAGANVHAIDLSTAVEAAAQNLRDRPNVWIYQADIMKLPFADGTFDFIYSIGVLHHTPNTRAAFDQLPRLLKPGGRLAVWVYSTLLRGSRASTALRLVTPHLPKRWLLEACRIAVPLYRIHQHSSLGRFSTAMLPTTLHPIAEWRWLGTFDWYSPRYQWKHTDEEVEGWFRDAGLVDVRRGSFPVSVAGTRAGGVNLPRTANGPAASGRW
jgi:2-polyprenyl-3-methyl-5-hydroxy-6-metoxy-1,4-benzoquinol methylase